ncbi:MAG: PaaI family thioesterase [Thermodesulfobacteriota bacterium]|nr:PaaI family thioesterase [Thermodesulfobacteriota bacterium]
MREEISSQRKAFLANDYSRGFIEYCQFRAETIKRGYFQSRVRIKEHHRQQDGFIHAGVMATMADHTAGYSAFTLVEDNFQILTIEFKINFLRPAFGDALVCRSRVIREGRQIKIAESEVFDIRGEEETLAAKAMVTLMAVNQDKLVQKR